MNTITRSSSLSRLAMAGAFALSLALAGTSYAQDAITEANLADHIATAKTAADHQAIANFYTAQAAAAGEKVKMHQAMDSAYGKSGQKGRTEAQVHQHCKDLISSYTKEQKDYQALAKEHEAMAAKAGK